MRNFRLKMYADHIPCIPTIKNEKIKNEALFVFFIEKIALTNTNDVIMHELIGNFSFFEFYRSKLFFKK